MGKRYTKEDKEWSEQVRERDRKCLICGAKDKRLNAHHLVPRQFKEYRLRLDNGVSLCVGCHTFGVRSAHKNPIWFTEWLRKNYRLKYVTAIERLRILDGGETY